MSFPTLRRRPGPWPRPRSCPRPTTSSPRRPKTARGRPKLWPRQPPRHPRALQTRPMQSPRLGRVVPRLGRQQRRRLRRHRLGSGVASRRQKSRPRRVCIAPRPSDGGRRRDDTIRPTDTNCEGWYVLGRQRRGGAKFQPAEGSSIGMCSVPLRGCSRRGFACLEPSRGVRGSSAYRSKAEKQIYLLVVVGAYDSCVGRQTKHVKGVLRRRAG